MSIRSLRSIATLALTLTMACGAPPDRKLTRPRAVPATAFEQRDIEVDGLRIRYVEVAPQAPVRAMPIVLLHGHTSRIEEYDELIRRLAAHWRVVAFDLPGSGYSDKPERDYDLRFYQDSTIAFLDAVGIDQAYLAGGSQGGNLVLRLGHEHPDRFPRLAAWAPGSAWPARPWLAHIMRATASYALFWPIVKVQSGYWYRPEWPLRQTMLDRTFAYYDEVMCDGFIDMYFGMAADQVGRTLFDIAADIRQPTLLLWGDQDHGANMGRGVQRLHEMMPNDELRIFQNAGHALANEVPDPLAAAIDFFFRSSGN